MNRGYYSSLAEFLADVRGRQSDLKIASGGYVWLNVSMEIPDGPDVQYATFLVDEMTENGWGQPCKGKRTPVKVRIA